MVAEPLAGLGAGPLYDVKVVMRGVKFRVERYSEDRDSEAIAEFQAYQKSPVALRVREADHHIKAIESKTSWPRRNRYKAAPCRCAHGLRWRTMC